MASDNKYSNSRAYKTSNKKQVDFDGFSASKTKKYAKKVKKSPLLAVIVVALIVGIIAGLLVTKFTSKFEFKDFYVAGQASSEKDYAVVDVSAHKEKLEGLASLSGTTVTEEQVYLTLSLEDKGVNIKFLGMDISDSLSVRYYYREDISHDIVAVDKIDVKTAGVYYIEYSSSHFAYKNTKLIRTIVVTGVELDG